VNVQTLPASNEAFANRVAELRKKAGLTQEQLADKLGLTYQAVSKWENALSCPDILLLPDLASLLGVSIDALLGNGSKGPAAASLLKPAEIPVQAEFDWPDDETLRMLVFKGRHLLAHTNGSVSSLTFDLEGTALNVICEGSLNCGDIEGEARAGGALCCGDIAGNAQANGNIECGDIEGDAKAAGYIECGDIEGGVKAGGSISCGDIEGSVHTAGSVTCGDVGGDVQTAGNVTCGDIGGNATAGTGISCGDIGGDATISPNIHHRNN
jgi:transcriptional regulator with XRE-family HTH domain